MPYLLFWSLALLSFWAWQAPQARAATPASTEAPRFGGASYLPPALADANALGPPDANHVLHFSAVLPARNARAHRGLIARLRSDPKAAPLDSGAYRSLYHPTEEERTRAAVALANLGFTPDGQAVGRVVPLRARVKDVEAALKLRYLRYQAADGNEFLSPSTEPHLPADLPVQGFFGLVEGLQKMRSFVRMKVARDPVARTATNGAAPGRVLTADPCDSANLPTLGQPSGPLLRKAYNLPDDARGKGQMVGLLAGTTVPLDDLQLYAAANNITVPKISYVSPIGSVPHQDTDYGEYALDLQMIMTMAPELDEIRVYMPSDSGDLLAMFNVAANPTGDGKLAPSLSASFGFGVSSAQDANAYEVILEQMVAQGQTLFVASGDDGAFASPTSSYPQLSANACTVGGTSLRLDPDGTYLHEYGWSGSGGGSGAYAALPAYQASLQQAPSQFSATQRNVPDVALMSGWVTIAYQGKFIGIGGTSASAPMWNGIMALVHEANAAAGKPPLGFINPYLYAMASAGGNDYAAAFHDVVDGTNGGYQAQPGYDLVTGWGTPNVTELRRLWGNYQQESTQKVAAFVLPTALR